MKKKNVLIDIMMLLLFVVGVGALAYPFVSDSINDFLDQQIINYYQERANRVNEEEVNQLHAEMEAKNKEIAQQGAPGVDPYFDIDLEEPIVTQPVSFYDEHTIGVVTIPKIDVRLPIFDQTLPVFLEKGSGLLEGTSYPTGGEDTHAVLTSHAGLTQAKLFTDLEKMEVGDQFFVEINNRTLAYEVDQVKVVLPTELDDVKIVEGEDIVTLLTCTPYMINSHRLLVRGHRIPYVPEVAKIVKDIEQKQNNQMLAMGGMILSAVLLAGAMFYHIIKSYLIANKTYELSAHLLTETNHPLAEVDLNVMNAKGTKPVVDDKGQPIILKTNHDGEIFTKELMGGKYRLMNKEKNLDMKVAIHKIKQEAFSIRPLHPDSTFVIV